VEGNPFRSEISLLTGLLVPVVPSEPVPLPLFRSRGFNVLAQTVHDRERLRAQVRANKPGALVVMDSLELTFQLKADSPKSKVIFRAYDPRDTEWHHHFKDNVGAYLDMFNNLRNTGIYVQVYNEPNTYQDIKPMIAWLCALVVEADKRGILLCVGNVAVGHPNTANITDWDPLIRLLAQYPRHLLGVHEYWQSSPVGEPQHIGRFQHFYRRADAIGVRRPNIVVTEFGRDFGGGHEDGWNYFYGGNQQLYWTKMQEAMAVYRRFNIPVCIFGYGEGGGGHWKHFDIQNANTLLYNIYLYGGEHPMDETPVVVPHWEDAKVERVPATFVNVRRNASTDSDEDNTSHYRLEPVPDPYAARYRSTWTTTSSGMAWSGKLG
jgi:hypothetical protein